jgi:hypothetical protein
MSNEELHNLYASLHIIRVIKSSIMIWTRHVSRMGEMSLVAKSEGKRPLGRPRRRWKDDIRMVLWEMGGMM